MTPYWRFFLPPPREIQEKSFVRVRAATTPRRATERTVHKALGLRSSGVTPTPLLAPNGRKKRSERALKLLFRLKERDATIGDEKIVT